ncbi:MAG: copper homeostasis periplasmic binding protein CopC [Pseudomonas sp.]|uniref:copper homeostasis periplasmic binding protein CopC n=1 Tax=unclassified Pseudomonas TaxID=196821 RepID=UPI001CF979B1|nr:copper homeostasis periplasmic binding protein CopC [Pseudomonas sp. L5B5]UCZ85230.1 copper homeostasis periplasmic binding protein CopC [Pseudomonas sp. L5B5]
MSPLNTLARSLVLGSALLFATLAQAHPKLLSSLPAEGARGPAPERIELIFSETLTPQFSAAKLLMTAMPGMVHPEMPIKARISAGNDPRTLLVTPSSRLSAGSYKVQWRAVSADTHPITGALTFTVE